MMNSHYTLLNDVTIPKLGFGTWMLENEDATKAVLDALEIGYRHIDTAQAYHNEKEVGEGIQQSNIDRKEVFITTKLAAEIKNYEDAVSAIEQSLKDLNTDYIDLMIIHSPRPWAEYQDFTKHFYDGNLEAWRALEKAYKEGKLRAIGVSNFEKEDLDNLLERAEIKPMVNQVLAHIGQVPFELIDFCQKHHILVEAYSPIAHGEMLKEPLIQEIAQKYQVTIPQLAIRYCLQLNLLPLPKAKKKDHMKNNTDVDFVISSDDMNRLNKVGKIDYRDNKEIPVFKKNNR